MTVVDVEGFINRADKRVIGDIELMPSNIIHGAFEFRCPVNYGGPQKVELNIWFNPIASIPKITIAYFVAGVGRIYGLCMNVRHAGMLIHKHNGANEDDRPYHPKDITVSADDPGAVWDAFCAESSLVHDGTFSVDWSRPWPSSLTET